LEQWKIDRLAKTGMTRFNDFMKEPYSPEMLIEENKEQDDDEEQLKPPQMSRERAIWLTTEGFRPWIKK
jgi:hypothetical protein